MAEASKHSLSNKTRRIDPIAEEAYTLDPAAKSMNDSLADKTPAAPLGLHLRCPQCLDLVAMADHQSQDQIQCTSCGSQIAWVGAETLASPAAAGGGAEIGQRIGRFELIERLGSGGFGEVWKARDTQLDRTVAVKIPHRGLLGPEEIEKFLREARAAAQLRHPNIVSVHEVGLEDKRIYIVADFIDGLSLDKWLAGRHIAYCDCAALCAKIAEGLHHAHEEGVIHRDLKPGNIMIDRRGEPHIMDFGLAKREAGETTMTVDGQILGTPAYMSPEQAKGFAHGADRRTDVYSLGVILFELLTGERPFRGSLQMLLKQVMQDDPVSPRKLDGRVPRDLDTICLKCLQKEPARRYPTARALSEELGRYLAGKPIQARPVSALERMVRWCGRNRLVAASALAAVLCLLFGLVAASIGYIRTSRALENSEESRRQERKAVDDWYTQISEDTLLKEPGMQRIRKTLLQRARDYYEKFLIQHGGDETIRDELAQAHFRLGWITEEIESPAKAMSSYQIAGEMQKQLLQSDQDNIERLKALGDTCNAMGRALQLQQQFDRALESYQKAIEVRGRLAALVPDKRESHRMLANTYMNIGLLEMGRGSYDEARRRLEQAQSIRLQPRIAGNDPKLRRDIAMGYYNLAKLSLAGLVQADKNYGSAREWCDLGRQWSRQAAMLFQVLAESDRADLDMRYLLAVCYRMEADLVCAEAASGLEPGDDCDKKRDDAIAIYQKSLDILEPLARKNPDVTEYQLGLAELYDVIAHVRYDQGSLETAMAPIDQAEAILTSLAADCGDTARYRTAFTGTWSFIGMYHTDPLRRRKALETLETWRKYLEQVAAKAPDAAGVQEPLQRTRGAIEIIKNSDTDTGKPPP
jgi:tetratricopeptide (TPR) repeat protein/ribosomal protein S27AE